MHDIRSTFYVAPQQKMHVVGRVETIDDQIAADKIKRLTAENERLRVENSALRAEVEDFRAMIECIDLSETFPPNEELLKLAKGNPRPERYGR